MVSVKCRQHFDTLFRFGYCDLTVYSTRQAGCYATSF